MDIVPIILIPIISALIGWFTNWVAIKMLFYPRQPYKFLGITFHGIFPKHQADVALSVGNMIASELLTPEDVAPHLRSKEQVSQIKTMVAGRIDDYLNGSFRQKHPVLSALLSDKRREEFKEEILDEIEYFTPEIIDQAVIKLEKDFDVARIISDRVAALEVDKLEKLLLGVLSNEFKFVEYIGGVIGLLIGLLQVAITFL